MTGRMKRVSTIAIAVAGAFLIAAAPVAADTAVSHSGNYGAHRLRDAFGYPGARCNYFTAEDQDEHSITVRSPVVFARNAYAAQLDIQKVGWRGRVQRLQSGTWTTVASSGLQTDMATDLHPAEFSSAVIPLETAGRHRVLVDMYWYGPAGTVVRGQSRHRVDFYAIVVDGEQVFQADSYC
jgi:hypothetical protein